MKAMEKVRRGTGFLGLLRYIFANEKQRFLGGNMISRDPRNLSREFAATRRIRPDIKKPVWHQALRLQKGENIDDDTWLKILNEYMQEMGFDPELHMYSFIMHDEKDAQHVHIAASRIALDGSLYYGQNENLKSTKIVERLEKKYGLKPSPKATNNERKERKPPKRNEQAAADRTGTRPNREIIQDAIDELIKADIDVIDFIIALEKQGITARPNIAKTTDTFNGFSFSYKNSSFKASSLGRKYSWPRLKKLVSYEPSEHADALREYLIKQDTDTTDLEALNDDRTAAIKAEIDAETERNAAITAEVERVTEQINREQELQQQLIERGDEPLTHFEKNSDGVADGITEQLSETVRIDAEIDAAAIAVESSHEQTASNVGTLERIINATKSVYTRAASKLGSLWDRLKSKPHPTNSLGITPETDIVKLLKQHFKSGKPTNFDKLWYETRDFMLGLIDPTGDYEPTTDELTLLQRLIDDNLDELINITEQAEAKTKTEADGDQPQPQNNYQTPTN